MWGIASNRKRTFGSLCLVVMMLLSGCGGDEPEQRTKPSAAADAPPAMTPESVEVAEAADPPAPDPVAPAPTPVREEPAPPASAGPTQHVVQGVVTQWRPMILFIEPGDTVVFRQMSGHDSESMEGLVPDGAEHWKSQLGEEGFSISPDVPGAYIYKCNPHVSTGMVGAIVVGEVPPANLAALQASPLNKGMIGRAIRKLTQAIDAR